MTDLQLEIQETIGKIIQLDKVRSRLTTTKSELQAAQKDIDQLEERVSTGLREIERLDGLSTRGIFYQILGNKESQLDKERQEFLDINLRYEDAVNRLKILEYEVNLLSTKLGHDALLRKRLALLKTKREDEIMASDPKLRSVLLSISEKLEAEYTFKKELEEAIEVGNVCLSLTSQVVAQLQKVRNWGNWRHRKNRKNRFRIKNEAIDRARNLAYQVKHHLRIFDKELGDVGHRLSIDLDYDVLNNFTNFFFDNLITDWIFQQKLTKALSSVGHTKFELEQVLAILNQGVNKCASAIGELKTQRETIVTT